MRYEQLERINELRKFSKIHFIIFCVITIPYILMIKKYEYGAVAIKTYILLLITFFLFHLCTVLSYKKFVRNLLSYESTSIVFMIELVGLNLLITMSLCENIPAFYISFFRPEYPYPHIISKDYVGMVNILTFIIVILLCINMKYFIKINNTLMYFIFFMIYTFAVMYHFAPPNVQRAVLRHFISPNNTEEIDRLIAEYYYPAIKEGVLAFIILDSSNLLTKLKDQIRNNT